MRVNTHRKADRPRAVNRKRHADNAVRHALALLVVLVVVAPDHDDHLIALLNLDALGSLFHITSGASETIFM